MMDQIPHDPAIDRNAQISRDARTPRLSRFVASKTHLAEFAALVAFAHAMVEGLALAAVIRP